MGFCGSHTTPKKSAQAIRMQGPLYDLSNTVRMLVDHFPGQIFHNSSTCQTLAIISIPEIPGNPYLRKSFCCHNLRSTVPNCARKLCGTFPKTRVLEKQASLL